MYHMFAIFDPDLTHLGPWAFLLGPKKDQERFFAVLPAKARLRPAKLGATGGGSRQGLQPEVTSVGP